MDRLEIPKPQAGPGQQLAPLLFASFLRGRLLGMLVADGLALYRRGFALLTVAAELAAAPVVSVSGLRYRPLRHDLKFFVVLHKVKPFWPFTNLSNFPNLPPTPSP